MPMTKEEKALELDDIQALLEKTSTVYLTNYSGLTVAQANELRNRFRDAGIQYRVLKNTLVRIAMQRIGGYDEILEHLQGPTAIAFTEEPAAPARVIKKFAADLNIGLPELKAAYIDGAVYGGAEQLDSLASLKSKDELIGDVLGLLLAPIANVVGGLQAQGSNLVGILQTLAERES